MAQADRYAPAIVLGKATNVVMQANTTYAMVQGEIAMATDQARFYIGDSSNRFADLCGFILPWVLVNGAGDIITNNGEVVWLT